MKKNITILCVFTILLMASKVSAEEPIVTFEFNGAVRIDWTGPWCVVPKRTWGNNHYQLKIRQSGTLSWDNFYTSSPDSHYILDAGYFEAGQTYDVKVKYHGRKLDCGRRQADIVRTLGTTSFVYDYEPEIPAAAVMIHNENNGKCIYPYDPDGPVGIRMHNWTCWGDPSFAFLIEPAGGVDEIRLRSLATGQCLQPVNDDDYEEIKGDSCLSVYSSYYIDFLTPDTFRLRNRINNKCLYGNNTNGGKIRQFGCWANPDMVFSFLDY
ncbi:RICIN domain-containing protein [Marinicella sp. W31]|uniref:RICIN domain-containing protein n=1 Tax=Marinicella sp. W31 TaxID=3023713 RepID=UPI0037565D62